MIRFVVLNLALSFGSMNNAFAAAELAGTRRGVAQNKELGDQLIGAAMGNNVSKVKELIMKNAPVNHMGVSGFSCLMIAASQGFCDIVKELLNAKTVVDLRKSEKY